MRIAGEAVLRLVVALLLGAAIGAEREAQEQAAGLRTHIAVCMGAALFGIVSTLGFVEFEGERSRTNVQIDVTRVASQVVVGIGFLGAGIIFRQGTVVRNLTTAASLWVVAAIGLTAGVGDLGTAAVAAGLMLLALVALLPLRNWIRVRVSREERRLRIVLAPGTDSGDALDALRSLPGVQIDDVAIDKRDGQFVLLLTAIASPQVRLNDRISTISARPDVTTLEDEP